MPSTVKSATHVLNAPHNSKLGKGIYTFSLPAGRVHCPGMSAVCDEVCYAQRGFFTFPALRRSMAKARRLTLSSKFVRLAIADIQKRSINIVRIHVSGDFYKHHGPHADRYVRQWIEIIKACPDTKFFAYTRSWRIKALVPALRALARLKNMQLWLSADRETGQPIKIAKARVAYLTARPGDNEQLVPKADLVFRNFDRHIAMKKLHGVQVCPVEDGVERTTQLTCTKCSICWKPPRQQSTVQITLPVDTAPQTVPARRR